MAPKPGQVKEHDELTQGENVGGNENVGQGNQLDKVDTVTGELISPADYTDEQLANLGSIADVKTLIGADAIDASDLGSGFAVLKEGDPLVGTPCIFLFWREVEGDFSDTYVSSHVVTFDPSDGRITGKYVYNDGSTGVAKQLRGIGMDARNLFAKHGLRKSEYKYCDDCGHVIPKKEEQGHPHRLIPGATFYIDTAA